MITMAGSYAHTTLQHKASSGRIMLLCPRAAAAPAAAAAISSATYPFKYDLGFLGA
jgi:hypothetical protein